jgi:hypothetical protein
MNFIYDEDFPEGRIWFYLCFAAWYREPYLERLVPDIWRDIEEGVIPSTWKRRLKALDMLQGHSTGRLSL